jgi:hypothetical protein
VPCSQAGVGCLQRGSGCPDAKTKFLSIVVTRPHGSLHRSAAGKEQPRRDRSGDRIDIAATLTKAAEMATKEIKVLRYSVTSSKTLRDVVGAVEPMVARPDMKAFRENITAAKTYSGLETVVPGAIGESELTGSTALISAKSCVRKMEPWCDPASGTPFLRKDGEFPCVLRKRRRSGSRARPGCQGGKFVNRSGHGSDPGMNLSR